MITCKCEAERCHGTGKCNAEAATFGVKSLEAGRIEGMGQLAIQFAPMCQACGEASVYALPQEELVVMVAALKDLRRGGL